MQAGVKQMNLFSIVKYLYCFSKNTMLQFIQIIYAKNWIVDKLIASFQAQTKWILTWKSKTLKENLGYLWF